METNTLLPDPTRFRLESIASVQSSLSLVVTSLQNTANCPLCGQASARAHSRYSRTLADLPWNRVAVRIYMKSDVP